MTIKFVQVGVNLVAGQTAFNFSNGKTENMA
jgi:hypothetical protein